MITRSKLEFTCILHILCIWNCSRGTLDLNSLDSVAAEPTIPA